MKKGKVLKRLFPISLCAVLLILSLACTSTTPTSTSVETLPLLLRYVDAMNYQDQLLKVTWNTKTGTVEIDTSTTLAFPNYANESNFWVTFKPWIGLSCATAGTYVKYCHLLGWFGDCHIVHHRKRSFRRTSREQF